MNIVENQSSMTSANDDHYNSDDGRPHEESLQPFRINYLPSPSPPPAVALPQVSPESSPEPSSPRRKGPNRPKSKNRPNLGDAVLVASMAQGMYAEVAREAGQVPLPSDDEDEETSVEGGTHVDMGERREEAMDPQIDPQLHDPPQLDLIALATGAMAQAVTQIHEVPNSAVEPSPHTTSDQAPVLESNGIAGEPMEDVSPMIPLFKLEEESRKPYTSDMRVKTELSSPKNRPIQIDGPTTVGNLPPILTQSPNPGLANGNGIKLPSITDQLGDLNHLTDAVGTPTFPQSPPGRPGLPGFPQMGHGSPPKSPNDTFRRELPSPGRAGPYGWRRPSQVDTPQYASAADYSSSNTETPSTDHSVSTPAMAMGIDRMSIDNMTNPQIGGFQCTYTGCTAQPFQTQYLLNSHANVHSSNRPHYCSVKGCPRSEGGKGFKRKNEMIRHGLVHDSPGYVCPFCPDREHKYPRPDNLQRHVRVHHVDKDRDDIQLRDVLSQRPEGPSRGRRRRGGTS